MDTRKLDLDETDDFMGGYNANIRTGASDRALWA